MMLLDAIFLAVFALTYLNAAFGDFVTLHFENDIEQISKDLKTEDVEDEILDLLGLPDPDLQQDWTRESLNQPAPNFLLKMYERISGEEKHHSFRKRRFADQGDEDMFITPFDELELYESDNIMTFMGSSIPLFNEAVFRRRQEHVVWFNASQIPNDVRLMAAQLKVYKRKGRERHKQYEISAYSIIIQGKNEIGLNLESSVQIPGHYEGWLHLNITEAVSKWHKGAKTNRGIYMEVNSVGDFVKKEVCMTSSGFTSMNRGDNTKPFMVGYFKNNKDSMVHGTKRKQFHRSRRQHQSGTARMRKVEQSKNQRSCQKLNFSVDFKKLNWLNWIVAPEKFDSYFCSGDCSFPLNDINTTNHAIIQTLAHLKNPDLPKPCCAPTALTSIVIIYHVSKEVVNMKKYNNMVVKTCGCL